MNAVYVRELGGPERLVYLEAEEPTPGARQVLIETRCTSVNFADIKSRRHGYRGQTPPFVPGLDASGVIEAVGAEVRGLRPGQRVAAYTRGGSYAEKVLADDVLCFPLPEGVSFEQGAGIGVLITAYNVIRLAGRLREGERVLVHAAAGGVGSSALQIARALGAGEVIATVGSEEKRRVAAELGADHVIDYRRENFSERVMDLTADRGVDLILDGIAGEVSELGMRCLANFGRLVVFGHTLGDAGRFDTKQLHAHNRAVIGYSSGGFRKADPEVIRNSAGAVLELVASGEVEVLIGSRLPLAQASEAHALVEGRKSVGKVLLCP